MLMFFTIFYIENVPLSKIDISLGMMCSIHCIWYSIEKKKSGIFTFIQSPPKIKRMIISVREMSYN